MKICFHLWLYLAFLESLRALLQSLSHAFTQRGKPLTRAHINSWTHVLTQPLSAEAAENNKLLRVYIHSTFRRLAIFKQTDALYSQEASWLAEHSSVDWADARSLSCLPVLWLATPLCMTQWHSFEYTAAVQTQVSLPLSLAHSR